LVDRQNLSSAAIRGSAGVGSPGQAPLLRPRDESLGGRLLPEAPAWGAIVQSVLDAAHLQVRLDADLRRRSNVSNAQRAAIPMVAASGPTRPFKNVTPLTTWMKRAEAPLAKCLTAGDDLASAAVCFGAPQGTLRGAIKAVLPKRLARRSGRVDQLLTRIDLLATLRFHPVWEERTLRGALNFVVPNVVCARSQPDCWGPPILVSWAVDERQETELYCASHKSSGGGGLL
jgi:hypothetical protein